MTVSARLEALGLELPRPAQPVGSYVPAVTHGGLIYTSGQLPFVDGALLATGVVGDSPEHVSVDVAALCARHGALNALAAAADLAGGVDQVLRVVRVVGYVASAPGFTAHPTVINGASDVLGKIFGDAGRHARSAVGVASLPLGAPVEIELVVEIRQ